MTSDWIKDCWARRNDIDAAAADVDMGKFRMAPFHGLVLSFFGFSDDEKQHMEESTEQQVYNISLEDPLIYQADVLGKVYPPFVNYFEISKETVLRCDKESPRFHAFLRASSTSDYYNFPENQGFAMDGLDIIKRTDKKFADKVALEKAADALKNVLTHINENKRKTDGQVQMFEILRDVDGCPAYVLSSHRSYVTKADTFELSDGLVGKGEPVTIFLFNDSLEVTKHSLTVWVVVDVMDVFPMTKRRGLKMNLPMKSPAARTPQKAYKHVLFIPLAHVKRVVNIRDNEGSAKYFMLKIYS
ncbi:predicted protein [Nematostella vectensis]|uniref:ECT2 PH domain-containing protein n=1 Tax=Nematostella vectensis TaxID=45351 RepID=A7T605_NEMVE|nr:predicted protein [Nematostella vectensis]|eukprot:XP_001620705.1 hypothetical protein NEMVEDRAFT_v1g222801 [Nematostella vectensis]